MKLLTGLWVVGRTQHQAAENIGKWDNAFNVSIIVHQN